MAANLDTIVEQLSTLSVLEAAELVKKLEEKWGVSAAAPVAMAAMPGAGPAAAAEPVEEKTEFDVVIKETGAKKTINGFDTRQVVMTIALREKGKTLEESGGLVLTSDMWMGPKVDAMKEIVDFDLRYAKQVGGPMVAGASPEQMAAAMAMYPGMTQALARMRAENVNLDGTAILTTVTIDAVKSAEQMTQDQKQDSTSSSSGGGGLLGGLARRAMQRKEDPKARATFMTMTSEVLKLSTDVPAADVALPPGFKEN